MRIWTWLLALALPGMAASPWSGERFDYDIDYGFISAGTARLAVDEIRPGVLRFLSTARSANWFDDAYTVRDTVSTEVDANTLLPYRFVKKLNEGSWHNHQYVTFDGAGNAALADSVFTEQRPKGKLKRSTGDLVKLDGATHTVTSAFYFFRIIDFKPKKTYDFLAVSGKKKYKLKVIVHGFEKIKVPAGTFDCAVVEPIMDEDGLFKANGKLTVWISRDARRIPVQVKSKIAVGSITVSLRHWVQPGVR